MRKTFFLVLVFCLTWSSVAFAPPPGKLQVAWNPVSTMVSGIPIQPGVTKTYRVYRSQQPNGPWSLIATTTNTSYLDTGLQPNHQWYYYVTVTVNAVESNRSNVVLGQT